MVMAHTNFLRGLERVLFQAAFAGLLDGVCAGIRNGWDDMDMRCIYVSDGWWREGH